MNERLRILYVAYPLLPVADYSAGGAEQMLHVLEREMSARGHYTAMAACEGSVASGSVIVTGVEPNRPDLFGMREIEHSARIVEFVLRRRAEGKPFDLIHDKSGHFWKHASALAVPVLATLHLPRHFYREDLFSHCPPNLFFNCVSGSQLQTFRDLPHLLGAVQNGIIVERFRPSEQRSNYLLWIGRICEEKGAHVAIDVAERAGMPLILVGQVYPFSYHQRYFKREIESRLKNAKVTIQFVERPSFEEKLDLLQRAQALLVPTLVDETSSLVAMEAGACGTPVVAFRRGALPEVVAEGETGFVVNTAEQMIDALQKLLDIDPAACRRRVETLFSSQRMADDYEALYQRVLRTCEPEVDRLRVA